MPETENERNETTGEGNNMSQTSTDDKQTVANHTSQMSTNTKREITGTNEEPTNDTNQASTMMGQTCTNRSQGCNNVNQDSTLSHMTAHITRRDSTCTMNLCYKCLKPLKDPDPNPNYSSSRHNSELMHDGKRCYNDTTACDILNNEFKKWPDGM
jgi:hypothetical protein